MHRSRVIKIGLLVLPNLHCVGDSSSRDSGTAARTSPQPNPAASQVEARCYRSSESVLLGPPTRRGQTGHAPGWIRLEGYGGRDSGDAELVDAAGFGLGAGWHRSGSDSVRVVGADDFLRTELRLLVFGDSAVGQGSAHSDADLEPDDSGQLVDLRRAWWFSAKRVPCDSMPRRAGRQRSFPP